MDTRGNMKPLPFGDLCLELALFAENGILPQAGGLFDQDNFHVMLIRAGMRAFAKKREREHNEAVSKTRH